MSLWTGSASQHPSWRCGAVPVPFWGGHPHPILGDLFLGVLLSFWRYRPLWHSQGSGHHCLVCLYSPQVPGDSPPSLAAFCPWDRALLVCAGLGLHRELTFYSLHWKKVLLTCLIWGPEGLGTGSKGLS